MWSYERIHDITDTDDCHPSARGHQQLAEYIYQAMQ
jgi:lysophospholipase L1-like esterase